MPCFASVVPPLAAAQLNDRALRKAGVTVRSGLDVLIAAFCIHHDDLLLHGDRDFDAFERGRGLRTFGRRAV